MRRVAHSKVQHSEAHHSMPDTAQRSTYKQAEMSDSSARVASKSTVDVAAALAVERTTDTEL